MDKAHVCVLNGQIIVLTIRNPESESPLCAGVVSRTIIKWPRLRPIVWTHFFFFFLLCRRILFIEIFQKRISKLRRCFLITPIIGGAYGAEEHQTQIYYKQDVPLEQLAVFYL